MEFSREIFAFNSLNFEPMERPSGNATLSHCDTSVQNTLLYLDTAAITLNYCTNTNKKSRFHKTGLFLFCFASSFY